MNARPVPSRLYNDGDAQNYKLYACPFCLCACELIISSLADQGLVEDSSHMRLHLRLVCCGSCGATGPWGETALDAAEFWNSFTGGRRPIGQLQCSCVVVADMAGAIQ